MGDLERVPMVERPLIAVPTLDEIARDPTRASALPVEVARALLSRCVVVQAALIVPALAAAASAIPPADEDDEWISQKQAEKMLNVSAKWFARRKGKLPFVKPVSPRKVVISKKGLLRWMGRRTA